MLDFDNPRDGSGAGKSVALESRGPIRPSHLRVCFESIERAKGQIQRKTIPSTHITAHHSRRKESDSRDRPRSWWPMLGAEAHQTPRSGAEVRCPRGYSGRGVTEHYRVWRLVNGALVIVGGFLPVLSVRHDLKAIHC